jgi:hypothetical protein
MQDFTYLIIAGTTKAGTTSLFLYLADHPDICGSSVKETGFFLDDSYPQRTKYRLADGLDKYEAYFNECAQRPFRLDATPDYLYSVGAAGRIRDALPTAKLLFILRDPVERLISWYRFAKQIGRLAPDMDFNDYVWLQLEGKGKIEPGEQHLLALEQGRYSRYLQPFFEAFPAEQLCVVPYDLLRRDARALMRQVCHFLAVDPGFYVPYRFEVFNQSQTMKNVALNRAYVEGRAYLQMRLNMIPPIKMALRPLRRRFEPWLLQMNRKEDEAIQITADLQATLACYYQDEAAALERLLGGKAGNEQ